MRYSAQGPHEFSDIRLVPDIKVVTFKKADLDADGKFSVPVEPGTIVLGVGLEVVSAFTGATDVIVGDGDDADGYIKTSLVDLTAAGAYLMSLGGTGALAQGKVYSAVGNIIIDTTGNISAGEGRLHIMSYTRAGDWRVPAV